ncbi:MAG: hypothetical protein JWM59_4311 [Verrucomicrobiales bacterium]|nr:hypothetical protein [Verrucomicrobiales bacterium]
MIIILNPTSPAEAAREKKLLKEAADEVLASPRLMDEFLKKLGLDKPAGKNRNAMSQKREKQVKARH